MAVGTGMYNLKDGSRIGIVGAGPAGSFTAFFLLEMAERIGMKLQVDLYDPKDFRRHGPIGCNHCGGIISESLVQALATEGIVLPNDVVQRGIDSYMLHIGSEEVSIQTPLHEMRLAALHRGRGPSDCSSLPTQWASFDGFLLDLAVEKGATHHRLAVEKIGWENGRPVLEAASGRSICDLVIGAIGVNAGSMELFRGSGFEMREAERAPAAIAEVFIGHERVQELFGSTMHVFMLKEEGVEFAALIPKGEYITACLLGPSVDRESMKHFLTLPEVQRCLPIDWTDPPLSCRCQPWINVGASHPLYANRVALVGDCGVSRLYKDGIGAAYRTAKACAVTAVFHGVSRDDFATYYGPTCERLSKDNLLGHRLFRGAGLLRDNAFLRRATLRLVRDEQADPKSAGAMSGIFWDLFTGSASYRDIFLRAVNPGFLMRFAAASLLPKGHGG